jgi:hypothetical protein
MRSVEEDQLKQTPERAESWIAEDLAGSHETVKKEVREQVSDYLELSPPEFIMLVAQCSILVVVAGIVAGLIAA